MFTNQRNESEFAMDVLPGYRVEQQRTLYDGAGMLLVMSRDPLADPSLPKFLVSVRRGERVERLEARSMEEARKVAGEIDAHLIAA